MEDVYMPVVTVAKKISKYLHKVDTVNGKHLKTTKRPVVIKEVRDR